MTNIPSIEEQLNALAQHLSARREDILQRWRDLSTADPELTTLRVLSRSQFHDHIPALLDAFAHHLRSHTRGDREQAEAEERGSAAGHGLLRWQQGYRQREVLIEWHHLHLCLADELEEYARVRPELQATVMPVARRALTELCGEGICESAARYTQLQQLEATERLHYLEQALAELKVVERQRAEALREAAHDLRGNLGIVTSAAAVLNHENPDHGVHRNVVDILQRGVHSLHALLDDLMSLARLEAGHEQRHVERFDAAVLLKELCTNLQATAEERQLFLEASGPDTLPVEGDPVKVRRIVQNLLLNALAHTGQGGVKVSWEKGGTIPRWYCCVQDTGPGFSGNSLTPIERVLKSATDNLHEAVVSHDTGSAATPAPTLDTRTPGPALPGPGEGIGLSIVKHLCDLLNASIELETEAGQGSTFRITFPLQYPLPEQPSGRTLSAG